jgi:hypothetical protein
MTAELKVCFSKLKNIKKGEYKMKKNEKIRFVLALVAMIGMAQTPISAADKGAFNAGDFIIGVAGGIDLLAKPLSYPFDLNVEYGITNNIGLGLIGGYEECSGDMVNIAAPAGKTLGYRAIFTSVNIPIGLQAFYHFDLGMPSLDLALGVVAGYSLYTATVEVNAFGSVSTATESEGNVFVGGKLNARFFLGNIAIKLGAGYTYAMLTDKQKTAQKGMDTIVDAGGTRISIVPGLLPTVELGIDFRL